MQPNVPNDLIGLRHLMCLHKQPLQPSCSVIRRRSATSPLWSDRISRDRGRPNGNPTISRGMRATLRCTSELRTNGKASTRLKIRSSVVRTSPGFLTQHLVSDLLTMKSMGAGDLQTEEHEKREHFKENGRHDNTKPAVLLVQCSKQNATNKPG